MHKIRLNCAQHQFKLCTKSGETVRKFRLKRAQQKITNLGEIVHKIRLNFARIQTKTSATETTNLGDIVHKIRLKRAQNNAAQNVPKNVRVKKSHSKMITFKGRSQEPRLAPRQTRKRQPKMISFKGKGQGSTADSLRR